VQHVQHHNTTWQKGIGALFQQPIQDTAHVFPFPRTRPAFHSWFFTKAFDIVFLQEQTVVQTATIQPFSTITPSEPVTAVIELPLGTVQKHDVKTGDTLIL
jgi:uncharacterized membrane protein (UPF0127 family)